VSGQYQFWLASDDNGQLRISSQLAALGANPTSLTAPSDVSLSTIASVSSWTDWREWNKFGSQQSAVLNLTAGFYYLKGIYKEGGGGDNLSVAWKRPGNTFSIPPNSGSASPYIVPQAHLYIISSLPTSVATPTFTPSRTPTPAPTNTIGPTPTPRPPTNTPTIGPSPTPSRTPTPVPPTNTRTPGPTETEAPTNTPRPATATNTPAPTNTPPIPCPYTGQLAQQYCDGPWLKPGVTPPPP
jgi:hypothetical protein